jgi:hypothetical protein
MWQMLLVPDERAGDGASLSDYKNRGLLYVTLLHGTDHH